MGQILGYYEGSVEEFVADGLDQSTPSGDITFILGNGDEGDGFCTQNKVFKCGGGSEPTLPAYAEYTGTATAVVVTTKYGYFPDTLVEGARVAVKFEGSLTYITSLNVNDTGAKNVYYKGNSLTSGMINRYNTYEFVYDGSYWRIIGVNTDTDTHYTAKNIVGASTTAKANATATNGNVHLNLVENSIVRSTHNIKGENGVEVTSDASGNITISGSGSGGGGSYVPMPETFVEQGGALDYTLLPNSSVYAFLVGAGRVSIYLQEPTSFDVVNEYTMIFRTFGFGNAITLDKTIIWANDNPPVLDDSAEEIIEISVKCINASMYDGIQYLGTWTKYSV